MERSGSRKISPKQPHAGKDLRLQGVAPTKSPYSTRAPLGTRTSRCSHDLFPLQGLQLSRWAEALPSCASSALLTSRPKTVRSRRFSALQGVDPTEPGSQSEDQLQPPWGLSPHPIPRIPPPRTSKPVRRFLNCLPQAGDSSASFRASLVVRIPPTPKCF